MYGIYCTEARGREAARGLSACDITILYPMGIATMDTHRTLERERKRKHKLVLLETVLQSRSLSQLSNGDRTSDCIVIKGCGQITQRSTNFIMDYHRLA